jgi:hypothetical protein
VAAVSSHDSHHSPLPFPTITKFAHFHIKVGHGKFAEDNNDFPLSTVGADLVAMATIIVYATYW